MCLAIFKPRGRFIPREHLEEGFARNKDGAGYAYHNGQKLVVKKGFFKFGSFYDSYVKEAEEHKAIIHFRYATSGLIDVENCHPFTFHNDNYAVIHNGVLDHRNTKKESDTNCFVKDILSKVPKKYSFNKEMKKNIGEYIGKHNKMVIMSSLGKVMFINEDGNNAHWNGGIWYSNDSYENYGFDFKKWDEKSYVEDDCESFEICEFCQNYTDDFVIDRDFTVCGDCYKHFVN